jgi:uncharacterized NAD(P)/FAD-binding protein YdhS
MSDPILPPLHVAIIGGGFSGTLVAIHLLRGARPVHIDLIDPRGSGRGLAYSTIWDDHLLNVPAVRMSAFGSEPMNFLNWLHANGKPTAPPDYFAPRKLFGTYIQDLLQTGARDASPRGCRFRQHYTEATALSHDGLQARVALANGDRIRVDRVVIATGNPAPRPVPNAPAGYFGSPWLPGALAGLDPDSSLLFIGAGLTAVDALLALESQGHRGKIHCVSRRGKLPHAHTFYRPLHDPFAAPPGAGARELLRAIRRRVREAEAHDVDWRAVVDSLRSVTNDIWVGLEIAEQRRVLRHLKTWWDIHRHRMAPEIGARVNAALFRGQLQVHAGRVQSLLEEQLGIEARIALRNGEPLTLNVARVINCTGSDEDYRRVPNPLIQSLLSTERIAPNYIGKGIRTDPHGAIIDADGVTTDWLLTLGPPRLGGLFETTAVPELRKQAEALASYLSAVIYEPVEVPVELYLAAGI